MDFNLPSNWWVSLLQKTEFAVLVLGFEKLGLGLDNCGRKTKNAYCRIYSLWVEWGLRSDSCRDLWTMLAVSHERKLRWKCCIDTIGKIWTEKRLRTKFRIHHGKTETQSDLRGSSAQHPVRRGSFIVLAPTCQQLRGSFGRGCPDNQCSTCREGRPRSWSESLWVVADQVRDANVGRVEQELVLVLGRRTWRGRGSFG